MNQIGQKIKNLRQQKNWTQTELGEKVGYSPQTISAWERGQNQPDIQAVSALCKLFDVSADDFFNQDEPPTVPTETKAPPTFQELQRAWAQKKAKHERELVNDYYEHDCGASLALKILIIIYGAMAAFVFFGFFTPLIGAIFGMAIISIITLIAIITPFLDIAIFVLFFCSKRKNYSTMFAIVITALVLSCSFGIADALIELSETLIPIANVLDLISILLFPFAFVPSNDEGLSFRNYISNAKGYYIVASLFVCVILLYFIPNASFSSIAVFFSLPLYFLLYLTLYRATKNKTSKHYYTTARYLK